VTQTTKWTTANIRSQAGRLAIVTGSTSGIGYQTALALAGAGARVVIAARNEKKAHHTIAAIRRVHPDADVGFRWLDTARLASVSSFAAEWDERRPIDILVLNAGIASVPQREQTEDGFERQLATNYLGHFALAGLLLPQINSVYGSRIVQVASIAHRRAQLHFKDLQLNNNYDSRVAYNQSKLAILMFGLKLDRRLRATLFTASPTPLPARKNPAELPGGVRVPGAGPPVCPKRPGIASALRVA
jgi:NAD(P)-dependent dehydrogenase (short-subunit alcohol dehydrogenase family)